MTTHSEFTVPGLPRYNHKNATRWILSHLWQHRLFLIGTILFSLISYFLYSQGQVMIGRAAQEIINPTAPDALLTISLITLAVFMVSGITGLIQALALAVLALRLETSARHELYASLLGKSQTFHDRQRTGDIMAMATDDMQQLSSMVLPGVLFILDIILGFTIPTIFIASIRVELLIVPLLFVASYILSSRVYVRRLNPVAYRQREQFGKMNAVAEETISGIEIVKASAREPFERRKFRRKARLFRGFYVRQGLSLIHI